MVVSGPISSEWMLSGVLLADLGEIIGALIPIVAILFWVLNHLFGGQAKPPARQAQLPRRQPAVRPRAQQPVGGQQVNDEVAEFLRRAAGKRGGQRPAEVEVVRPKPVRLAPRRLEPAKEVIATAEVVEDPRLGGRVAGRVLEHRGPTSQMERPGALPAVDQADEKLEKHLHEAFDHQLGSLRARYAASATKPTRTPAAAEIADAPLAAAGFAALLGSAQGARQAIILSEILARPEDRWK